MTRKKLESKTARRVRAKTFAELMVAFGLYQGISGRDPFARRERKKYRREVESLLARAADLGMGRDPNIKRVALKFYVLRRT